MINLLPKAYKADIRAARTNVILIRYITIIFFAFLFLILILAGSMFLLSMTKRSSELLIEANAAEAAQYSETSNEINRLKSSLTTSKAILDEQISYTKVLNAVAAAMPAGTIIGSLKINDESFNGSTPTTLQVYAKTNEAAVQLGQAFTSTPGFAGATIDAISDTGGIDGYPVSATLTVTLNRSIAR